MNNAGFFEIKYRGKPMFRKGEVNDKVQTIVMRQSDPNRLDMRFKCNREFLRRTAPPGTVHFLNTDHLIFGRYS